MKQICGSETNAAFTSAVNESGDFRFWQILLQKSVETGLEP